MKLRGKKLDEKNSVQAVFPRPSGPIVFTLSAVLNTSDFDRIYPLPVPPIIIRKGNKISNTEAPAYLQALAHRNASYTAWLVINSMSATPDLEWEEVKIEDPNTWVQWKDELKNSGLTEGEIMYLINKTIEVNALDEKRLDEARDSFLLGHLTETSEKLSSPSTEPPIT